jgi:hypothetical protein
MKPRTVAVFSMTLALAVPAVSQAAYPKTKNKSIVLAKSIGGFSLGGSPKALARAWGAPSSKCDVTCDYNGKSGGSHAEVQFVTNRAVDITILTAIHLVGNKDIADCSTPLTKYETSKGIHLCSTVRQLKNAYHTVKKLGTSAYVLKGAGGKETTFSKDDNNTIFAIAVQTQTTP